MLRQIPYKLFVEWQYYYELEPFGPLRDNFHAAIVATSIWQSQMAPRERNRIGLEDFILDDPKEKEKLEPQEMFAMLKIHIMRGSPNADR